MVLWMYSKGWTPKDELPDQRGSLANDIPSHAIEQANQEFIVIYAYLNSVLFNFVY